MDSPMIALPKFCSIWQLVFPSPFVTSLAIPMLWLSLNVPSSKSLWGTFCVSPLDVDGIWVCPQPFCRSAYTFALGVLFIHAGGQAGAASPWPECRPPSSTPGLAVNCIPHISALTPGQYLKLLPWTILITLNCLLISVSVPALVLHPPNQAWNPSHALHLHCCL